MKQPKILGALSVLVSVFLGYATYYAHQSHQAWYNMDYDSPWYRRVSIFNTLADGITSLHPKGSPPYIFIIITLLFLIIGLYLIGKPWNKMKNKNLYAIGCLVLSVIFGITSYSGYQVSQSYNKNFDDWVSGSSGSGQVPIFPLILTILFLVASMYFFSKKSDTPKS